MIEVGTNVPVTDPEKLLFGFGLLDSSGRGVVNGVPYGEQLEDEKREIASTYMFSPTAASALRAATKRALGR